MHQLNIDFIGPFPDQGYILVIVATFTRWVELYYTTDASAAEWFLKHSSRFGAPHQLRSDNGPHFIAEVIRESLHPIGVSHTLTLAYNKEINRHTFQTKICIYFQRFLQMFSEFLLIVPHLL